MSKSSNDDGSFYSTSDTSDEETDDLTPKQILMRNCVAQLPIAMQNRVLCLKDLQVKSFEKAVQLQKAKMTLKQEHMPIIQQIFDKRNELVNGTTKPNDDEKPKWQKKEKQEKSKDELDKDERKKIRKMVKHFKPIHENAKGIPGFWLSVMKTFDSVAKIIHKKDEKALKFLKDIKIVYPNDHSFMLEFHFDANNGYFTNSILTKEFQMKLDMDEEEPLAYDGNEFEKCKGCIINWVKNKSLTCCNERGRPRNRKIVYDTLKKPSFFHFFSIRDYTERDYSLGLIFRDQIVPKAILYYTGDLQCAGDDDNDEGELNYGSSTSSS